MALGVIIYDWSLLKINGQYHIYIKPLIDNEVPNITDVPYEAAIAAFGALFAGIFGLFASYCRKSRLIRIIYAFLSLRKCF